MEGNYGSFVALSMERRHQVLATVCKRSHTIPKESLINFVCELLEDEGAGTVDRGSARLLRTLCTCIVARGACTRGKIQRALQRLESAVGSDARLCWSAVVPVAGAGGTAGQGPGTTGPETAAAAAAEEEEAVRKGEDVGEEDAKEVSREEEGPKPSKRPRLSPAAPEDTSHSRTHTDTLAKEGGSALPARPAASSKAVVEVREKVVMASAKGSNSGDVLAAAHAVTLLLGEAMAGNTARDADSVVALCAQIGLTERGCCSDDVILKVADRLVTPLLSGGSCDLFVRGVFLPRCRALTAPASRVLVTAVSHVAKQRPDAVVNGLILALLCGGADAFQVGSAQCELCTRMLKTTLSKRYTEPVLWTLCTQHYNAGPARSGPSGGFRASEYASGRGSLPPCVWTEATVPVITMLINQKMPLSDETMERLVQCIESSSEVPEMQKSLKFTTLVHSVITKYGPQALTHAPVLEASLRRCSTFMVKTALAALQRQVKGF